ncbi:MAG: hypothetical protein JW818_02470 [Pirellulales bacterium]|nr:hypothetical protein [Pirellulales bacterium]
MSNRVYFVQECPTCGRHLHIRVEYLGKRVACQHCHGKLDARDPSGSDLPVPESGQSLLERADQLLQSTDTMLPDSDRTYHPR